MQTARLFYLVRQAQYATYSRLQDVLRAFGLTATEYMVLSILGTREELSSAQLSRRFTVTPQTMMRLVAGLEGKGLISREEAPENKRILRIRMTAEGRRVLAKCEAAVDRLEADVLANFSDREKAEMRKLLGKFIAEMRQGGEVTEFHFMP